MKRLGSILALTAVVTVIGCTTMTPQQQGTVSGAAIGAAAGAGIAAIAGGSGWTGAAVGAVAAASSATSRAASSSSQRRPKRAMEDSLIAIPVRFAHRAQRLGCALRSTAVAGLLTLAACGPASPPYGDIPAGGEWREFQGTWTAAGSRHRINLGSDRRASIANLDGIAAARRARTTGRRFPRGGDRAQRHVRPAWWAVRSGRMSMAIRPTANCAAKARIRETGSSGRSSAARDVTGARPEPTSSRGDSCSNRRTGPCKANPTVSRGGSEFDVPSASPGAGGSRP